MEDDNLNKAVREIQEIKMTSDEKARVLKNVLDTKFDKNFTSQKVRSPYVHSFFLHISKKKFTYIALFAGIILVCGGSVAAASQSLPGSVLYPIKISILEPVRGAFIFSPIKKIAYYTDLATNRIIEAEILASQNKLDGESVDTLDTLLQKHSKHFDAQVRNYRATQFINNEDDDAVISFEARMNAHARVLDVINERQNGDDAKGYAAKIKTKNHTKISTTARDRATFVAKELRNREIEANKIAERYKKHKDTVQSIIDSSAKDLELVRASNSAHNKKIAEHADTALNQAKQFLKEGEDKDKEGDSKNAYGKLLDSESVAKEAEILLKTGLNLPDVFSD